MRVGVLAFQGDVREHVSALITCGVNPISVRRTHELAEVDALVIPGGESTTIAQLAQIFALYHPIKDRIRAGMPVYGSCAGMILLADEILGASPEQKSFGGLDISVRRNAFGRQVESFETELSFADGSNELMHAIFIRAPWVERVGYGVEVLTSFDSHPVAVRSKNILATAFHPEISGDYRVHRYFIQEVALPALQQVQ